MSGHWTSSTRRTRLPTNWPQLRTAVRTRAGERCEHRNPDGSRCPNPGTDCDHINPGDNHDLANLQWLCAQHHRAKSSAEGNAAMRMAAAKRAALKTRPTEPHPGRLGQN